MSTQKTIFCKKCNKIFQTKKDKKNYVNHEIECPIYKKGDKKEKQRKAKFQAKEYALSPRDLEKRRLKKQWANERKKN